MITLFCIRPQGFNVGNDAIYMGLRHLLYEAFGRVVNIISLPAVSHYESQAKAGLTARTIHEINQYGHGVIVGGGNLYENGELAIHLDALSALEPPLLLFSLSRGRIYNRHGELKDRTDAMPERVIKALNERADYSLARDQATLSYLNSLGVHRAKLGGCPTLFLDRVSAQLPDLPPGEKPGVLLSVRNPSLMNVPLSVQARIPSDVDALVVFLKKLDIGPVRLLCHDHRDIPFAAMFSSVEYVYSGHVHDYLALLRSSVLGVSFRLHATIPCIAFGRPSIHIAYDERSQSLLETVGLESWSIPLMDTSDVVAAVEEKVRAIDRLMSEREHQRVLWQRLYDSNLEVLRSFARDAEKREGRL